MNLGLDYKVLKFRHIRGKYIYIYAMPLNTYAVVEYEDDEEIVFSQFFWEWVDALHCFNKIKEEKEEQ